jgi:phage/plasmid-associated DNA primase
MQPSSLENPDNFNTYMLHGKLANMYMDIAKTSLKNTSLIKSLSGGDPITVPRKYKSPLTFKNTAKFIFGANELPYSYDITSGFWERWLLIDFPYTFLYEDRLEKLEESDKWKHKLRIDNITDIICSDEEMSGLLNWVLEGLHKLRADGRFSYKYTPEQVKSLWVRKSDSFSAFFMDFMEVDYDKKISKTELRKVYSEYCKEHQIKIMSDVHINKIMGEHGISGTRFQEQGKSDTYWIGASFKTGYRAEDNLEGIVTFQKPTSGQEVKTYIETNKDATKQDLIMKFGHGFVNKMLQNGDLIIIGKDKVAIK